jgi:hypothetical protein
MASKAARQEPTLKGYHTGTRMEAEDTIQQRCVLLEKTQGLTGDSGVNRCQGLPKLPGSRSNARRAIREEGQAGMLRGEAACVQATLFSEYPFCLCVAGDVR